ncbi:hypothetical protein CCZ01_06140 [Helicobacter monodelphidis]|uniref:restriction endonuclease subunit S n=1 Tax=Helicobacter sp. 15-1451 TaxID=2004995 RepID=UPI000DCE9BA3|nr:restriction endonuclease subunit S [Helicobacter sp. 15-1451]RAX57415.1 hypothetical protein CCZ01_06140 [Helicobacter sp. 15-1451]
MSEKLSLDSVEWGEFVIGEIFEVTSTLSGIDKNKLNGKEGKIPYITRTDKQNGIDSFIDTQELYTRNDGNVITIGLDTQTAFYQNNYFYTGQNIQILFNKKLNKYNAIFILRNLKVFMTKFNWGGNGATLTRLKRGKILLPKTTDNKPHWEFMESYMRQIEQKHLKTIIAYYHSKIDSDSNGGGNNL